ncbi:hypothetical protein GCM10029963_08910 [Micromonospora andamanensis]
MAVARADLAGYERSVAERLVPAMRAGHRLLDVFSRRPAVCHTLLATPPGWRAFTRFCLGRADFDEVVGRAPVRAALALADRLPGPRRGVADTRV